MVLVSGGPRSGGAGFDYKVVTVQEVLEDGEARCLDIFGNTHRINVSACRSKCLFPRQGEVWIIDQQYGDWMFGILLGGFKTPQVTGSRATADPVTLSLLEALKTLGLVRDGTTA